MTREADLHNGLYGRLRSAYPKRQRALLGRYDLGFAAASTCQFDQRFSYSMYVPPSLSSGGQERFKLLVLVHGTNRPNQTMLRRFTELADAKNMLLLAPLFPARTFGESDMDNYKYIEHNGTRFDLVLLHMVAEACARYDVEWRQFSLFGFSGGAHFSHRFFLLHAACLSAVSIAAPGSVTLIDEDHDWWVGTADVTTRFGEPIDLQAARSVAVHMVVGSNDLETEEITHARGGLHWMEGANGAGRTRIDRLRSLHENFSRHGIKSELQVVPNVGHEEAPLANAAAQFFWRLA